MRKKRLTKAAIRKKMREANRRDTNIQEAMRLGNKVSFEYTRKDGVSGTYTTEPYSFRKDMKKTGRIYFYGFHGAHSKIHSFFIRKMEGLRISPKKFDSVKWPTEGFSVDKPKETRWNKRRKKQKAK